MNKVVRLSAAIAMVAVSLAGCHSQARVAPVVITLTITADRIIILTTMNIAGRITTLIALPIDPIIIQITAEQFSAY